MTDEMERASVCVVCYKPTTLFNYGVPSCNACKMFFRRSVTAHRPKVCINQDGLCYSNPPINPECKFCRLIQCHRVGMHCPLRKNYQLCAKSDGLSAIIRKLSVLDLSRENNLLTRHYPEGLTMNQLFTGPLVNFQVKPASVTFEAIDWGFMEQIAIIDFMRKLEFVQKLQELNLQDYGMYMKEVFFKWSSLTVAMRNFTAKSEVVRFHGEFDVFAEEVVLFGNFPPHLLMKIRSQIIAKLVQLQITREEFLLVSMVLFCNPGIANLSASAHLLLSTYQSKYSDALLQYCFTNYGLSGPSRFTDLLSLLHVINRNFDDVSTYFTFVNMNFPPVEMPRLYADLFKFRFLV